MARVEVKWERPPEPEGVVDVTVTFRDFPRSGAVRWNRPHVEIGKNGLVVHEDQPTFNGVVYQLDPERIPVDKGDELEVVAWWDADEIRNGTVQIWHVVERWDA